jgi:integrin-linked kinase-associated serine/threonine phosphatase 2C
VKVKENRYGQALGPPRAWKLDAQSPGLAMSRSIGDMDLTSIGIISDPYIQVIEIPSSVQFVVLGTDGVFDVMTNKDVVEFVRKYRANCIH